MGRASTPLPKNAQPSFRVILEISNSSAEAVAHKEECFDIFVDTLEANFERMRINSTFESLESGELPSTSSNQHITN